MGLFDFLSGKGGSFKKHAARAANKRAQNQDRWESLQALADMKSAEAVGALLPRFAVRVDPSITDQEEKDLAFHGCIAAGEEAIAPTRAYLREADAISWPLKILEHLLPPEAVVNDLLEVLSEFDTEYERDPKRKIQVVAYLEDRSDPRVVEATLPFISDMNDEVRFHAVGAILEQDNADDAIAALAKAFAEEESMRVRVRVAEGFVTRSWAVPEEHREGFAAQLPENYTLEVDGRVSKNA